MAADLVERVREAILSDTAANTLRFGNAITHGFWSGTGREIPVVVQEAVYPGKVRLGDAGESWFELVSEGWSHPSPSERDRERIERLCEMHGVLWDARKREIYTECALSDAPRFMRKILAATIAMDGWRALHPADQDQRRMTRQEIVETVISLAPRMGLRADEEVIVGHSGHAWPADAILRADSERAAGVRVLDDTVPSFTEWAIGWSADTRAPMVVVASPMKAERLQSAVGLGGARLLTVPRDSDHLAERVLDAAGDLLKAA